LLLLVDMKSNEKTDQNNQQRAGERKRDEEKVADERGDDRYGHARNDDAEPSELVKADPDVEDADGSVESSGEQAGIGRGEKPRKPKARSTKNG
jgi:hypothetical protein